MIGFRDNLLSVLCFAFFGFVAPLFVTVGVARGVGRGSRARWNVYQNKDFHFRFLVPEGWRVNDQRTYPSVPVNLRSPEGSNVSMSIKVMPSRITLTAFARREVQVLKELGFPVSSLKKTRVGKEEALYVSGKHPRREVGYRLFFLQQGRVGYVLTFTFPIEKAEDEGRLFELILKTFTFTNKGEK